MSARYPVVTICGSMRYQHQMMRHAADLTRDGYIVLAPFVADYINGKPSDTVKRMLDDMHTHKIDMANQIHVIGEHIGESTRREISYAKSKGVLIVYYDGDLILREDSRPEAPHCRSHLEFRSGCPECVSERESA